MDAQEISVSETFEHLDVVRVAYVREGVESCAKHPVWRSALPCRVAGVKRVVEILSRCHSVQSWYVGGNVQCCRRMLASVYSAHVSTATTMLGTHDS